MRSTAYSSIRKADGVHMTKDEIERLLAKPTITVPEAGAILGVSRNPAYEAAGRGDFPTIKVGRSIKVPTAPLRRLLGLDGASSPKAA
jgi:hypothetical protein